MNRNGMILKQTRKADPRMPFGVEVQEMMTGYLSPQLHKNLRLLPSARKRKSQP